MSRQGRSRLAPRAACFGRSELEKAPRSRFDVQDDRDRAVVDDLDGHGRAEDATLDLDARRLERCAELLVERLRELGRRCVGEARPVAFCVSGRSSD